MHLAQGHKSMPAGPIDSESDMVTHRENMSVQHKPICYIVKLDIKAGVYLFFLFLLQNIDCGYSLEPPR